MENHDVLSVSTNKVSPQTLPAAHRTRIITANEEAGIDSIKEHKYVKSHFHQSRSRSTSCAPRTNGSPIIQKLGTEFLSLSMPCSPIKVEQQSQAAELFSESPRNTKLGKKHYESFKTWFENLERHPRQWHRKSQQTEEQKISWTNTEIVNIPVNISFDDLEESEPGILTVSEEIDLPEDTVPPFLLRFPVLWFGMCLGISSQTLMWKLLASSTSTRFLHVSPHVNLTLWCMSLALLSIISFIYLLKMFIYFEAVSQEFHHPIRVNFFFAPWTSFLFLALSVPPSISQSPLHESIWYILMAPIFCMDVKIYGQWMSGGKRRLSNVANPSSHLAVVGNFLGAFLGASMGLREGSLFFFAIGLAHYMVLFVTLYQRLPTNDTVVSKELHPVFFMFVAGPCAASTAWAEIQGSVDYGSRIAYFIGMFLYVSLAAQVNLFRDIKFSLAWWAYAFPITQAANATINYCDEVPTLVTKTLCIVLSAIATFTFILLFATTIVHALVIRDIFQDDKAIQISDGKLVAMQKWSQCRNCFLGNDTEDFLKYENSSVIDIEATLKS